MSFCSAPYPPDPGYDSRNDLQLSKTYQPRIKPEAKHIATLHQNGTIKKLLQMEAAKIYIRKKPKNYIKDNIHQIQAHKRKQSADSTKLTPLCYNSIKNHRPYSAPIADSKELFMKNPTSKNFILLNKKSVRSTPVRTMPQESISKGKIPEHKIGAVPKYLQHRKKMWLQQKLEETSVPDPTIPDGHIIMPTKDKVHTLQALQQDKEMLISELLSLPIVCHTLKQKQKKINLESKLNEIDDAIKIFSRPKVFIKTDI